MKRNQRFPFVLSATERAALRRLAEAERSSAAAVVRRLIWREARERGLLPPADHRAAEAQAHQQERKAE